MILAISLVGLLLMNPSPMQTTVVVTRPGLNRSVVVILATDVAERLLQGGATEADRVAVNDAVELSLGHVGEPKNNPCHKPVSNLINEGRLPNNCSDIQGVK